jgi:ATP-dependent helicase/nuclease subunit A
MYAHYDLSEDMFYRKSKGVPGFLSSLLSGKIKEPNDWVREIFDDPPHWSTGKHSPQLEAAIIGGFGETVKDAILYLDENIIAYNTAHTILSNIYALGILSDVLNNVHVITNTENRFLLSDAGEVINLITKGDQTPFIYEKVGTRFDD